VAGVSNLVVHFEIHASEPQRLIDFYSELLGWRFTRFGDMDYWSIETGEGSIQQPDRLGGGINGGLTKRSGPGPEPGAPICGANFVVAVDGKIDDTFQKGLTLGGVEAMPLDDMPGIGRVGYLLDPDGNVFGLISPELSDGTVAMGG
jgi:predicted enzyme related to lactoylglutathione lyase